MNSLTYYTRKNKPWAESEDNEIKERYDFKEMTINEIADLHYRTPGSISYRLKYLGLVNDTRTARGYEEYKNSKLYKEIAETFMKPKKSEKEKSQIVVQDSSPVSQINTKNITIRSLKEDIESLKKDVSEILRLMKAIYQIETHEE